MTRLEARNKTDWNKLDTKVKEAIESAVSQGFDDAMVSDLCSEDRTRLYSLGYTTLLNKDNSVKIQW